MSTYKLNKHITCYHPEMYPYDPFTGKPKPAPYECSVCDCGGNWCCPICGWGAGSWPCNCPDEKKRAKERWLENIQRTYDFYGNHIFD